MIFEITWRFNGRTTGKQEHTTRYEADSVNEAFELSFGDLNKCVLQHGGSICATGVTIDWVKQ